MMTSSSASDCTAIEQRPADGHGLLIGDGASRGNLFSDEADATILTVSRTAAEKRANPAGAGQHRPSHPPGQSRSATLHMVCHPTN